MVFLQPAWLLSNNAFVVSRQVHLAVVSHFNISMEVFDTIPYGFGLPDSVVTLECGWQNAGVQAVISVICAVCIEAVW